MQGRGKNMYGNVLTTKIVLFIFCYVSGSFSIYLIMDSIYQCKLSKHGTGEMLTGIIGSVSFLICGIILIVGGIL